MANPWDIAAHLEVEEDTGHPDGRHVFRAVVADLQWDEDPKPGRPEMTGQWRLEHVDGYAETIDLPRPASAGLGLTSGRSFGGASSRSSLRRRWRRLQMCPGIVINSR